MPLKLKRLSFSEAIGSVRNGLVYPDPAFVKAYNDNLAAIESHVTAIELQEALDAVDDALVVISDATTAAQDAADNANVATTSNARFLSIYNSTTTGLAITATDAGASVTVSFSAHTRNLADGTSFAVLGGSITGLAYSTQYFFAYDDPDLSGGAETYQAFTSGPDAYATAAGGSAPDRLYAGSVVTPAALGAPIDGAGAVGVTFDQPIGGNWL